jgi:hypothetical protein
VRLGGRQTSLAACGGGGGGGGGSVAVVVEGGGDKTSKLHSLLLCGLEGGVLSRGAVNSTTAYRGGGGETC